MTKVKSLINLSVMIFLIISCNQSEGTKEYLNADGYKTVGLVRNKKKDGIHISYYPNGNIREIVPYSEGIIDGVKVLIYDDSVKSKFNLKKRKLIWQIVIDTEMDTIYSYFESTRIMKHYYENNKKPRSLIKLGTDKKIYSEIEFDSLGRLSKFINSPLLFLTKKDTFDLDKAYPNWKEQVKEWEKKQ